MSNRVLPYRSKRIIISTPVHPMLFMLYLALALPLLVFAQVLFIRVFRFLGYGFPEGYLIASGMILFSLLFSPVNIKLKEIGTNVYTIIAETRYISFFGIPIPVVSHRVVERKIVIAVNIGGALIPITVSMIMLYGIITRYPEALIGLLGAWFVTSIVTFVSSRAIPGVGIAVPTLIPPLTAALSAIFFIGSTYASIPAAYIAGTLGSLFGADVLRLLKDLDKFIKQYGPTVASIGGAGTFDGVYLSGIFAVIMTILLT